MTMFNTQPFARASLVKTGLAALICASAGTASAANAADCDRACLKGHMDRYLDAVVKHDPSTLPFAQDAKIVFNGKPAKFDTDDWKLVDGIAFKQYVMDPVTGQVALFGVATENYKRGTFFVRLEVEDQKLTQAHTILGERRPDGVPGLLAPNPFFDYVLPKNQRRSRKELIAIADSYFEGLEKHDGKDVPISDDCRRFEDGVLTSLNPVFVNFTCNEFGFFSYIAQTDNRLYPIVDVERGLVLGQTVLIVPKVPAPPPRPQGPPPANAKPPVNPISGMVLPPSDWRSKPRNTIIHELFKVVDGKITEIQTIRLDREFGWGGGW